MMFYARHPKINHAHSHLSRLTAVHPIFTNYLEFRLFRDGEQKSKISIATVSDKRIKPSSENFDAFTDLLKTFADKLGRHCHGARSFHYSSPATGIENRHRSVDVRHTYYTGNSKGFHCRARGKIMRNFLQGENVGLVTIRRSRSSDDWREVFVTNTINSGATSISALDINYTQPQQRHRTYYRHRTVPLVPSLQICLFVAKATHK